jgi:hypothetical protein
MFPKQEEIMKFSELRIGQFFRGDVICLRVPPPSTRGDEKFINYCYIKRDWYDAVQDKPIDAERVWGRMDDDTDVVLVNTETGLTDHNTRLERCERCQDLLPVPCMNEQEESYYDWDNDDSDVAGSILETRTYYICGDREQCRHNRRQMAEVMRQVAVQQDGVMRESGWGAIGNGARGHE